MNKVLTEFLRCAGPYRQDAITIFFLVHIHDVKTKIKKKIGRWENCVGKGVDLSALLRDCTELVAHDVLVDYVLVLM